MKIILTRYADIAGQHYGPGTRLDVSDEIGNALIDQGKAQPVKELSVSAVDATEGAKKLAKEHSLDLGSIKGSGEGGRVLKGDVEKALAAKEVK